MAQFGHNETSEVFCLNEIVRQVVIRDTLRREGGSMSDITAQEIYQSWVWPLPVMERLRLATLILSDLPPALPVEDDAWSDQGLQDLTAFAWQHERLQRSVAVA